MRPTRTPLRRNLVGPVRRPITTVLAALALVTSLAGVAITTTASASVAHTTPTLDSVTLPTSGLDPVIVAPDYVSPAGVSCPTTFSCIAVGYYIYANGRDAFVAQGSLTSTGWKWKMTTVIPSGLLPALATTYPETFPSSIDCLSATNCVMTGQYIAKDNNYYGFAASGSLGASGWQWTFSTLNQAYLSPKVTTTSIASVAPTAIACASATACVISGQYKDANNNESPLVATGSYSSGTWSWDMSTMPTVGFNPLNYARTSVNPGGVSCPSAQLCVIGGWYQDISGYDRSFVTWGTLSGSTWTWHESTVTQPGLSPAANNYTFVFARAISCTSATTCLLSGDYYDSAGNYGGYLDVGTLSGSTWTWTATTIPTTGLGPASNLLTYMVPTTMSCPSASQCLTAGYYKNQSNDYQGFLATATQSSGVWSWNVSSVLTSTLMPTFEASTYVGGNIETSCVSVDGCVAIGNYSNGASALDGYTTTVDYASPASTPTISNLPTNASVGGGFTATITTNGDGATSVASSTPSVCSVSGDVVTFLAAGTCTLTAEVADGATTSGAVGSPQSVSVSAATPPAPQGEIHVVSHRTAYPVTATVVLDAAGGSGSGRFSYKLLSGKCVLTGDRLSAKAITACAVEALRAASTHFRAGHSAPVEYFFGFKAQKRLVLTASVTRASHHSSIKVTATGGAGTGRLSIAAVGTSCSYAAGRVRAAAATTCRVTATKAWSGHDLPATSNTLTLHFT